MAADSAQENEWRERRIAPDIAELRNAPTVKLVERYETRQGPDGYFIYDTQTQSIARIDGQRQSSLTFDQASEAVEALAYADAKGGLP